MPPKPTTAPTTWTRKSGSPKVNAKAVQQFLHAANSDRDGRAERRAAASDSDSSISQSRQSTTGASLDATIAPSTHQHQQTLAAASSASAQLKTSNATAATIGTPAQITASAPLFLPKSTAFPAPSDNAPPSKEAVAAIVPETPSASQTSLKTQHSSRSASPVAKSNASKGQASPTKTPRKADAQASTAQPKSALKTSHKSFKDAVIKNFAPAHDCSHLPIFRFATTIPLKARAPDAASTAAADQVEQENRRQDLKLVSKMRFTKDSSSASSSQSLAEGPTVDFKWFSSKAVKLFVALQCLDQEATASSISFCSPAAERAILNAVESEMSSDPFYDAFFMNHHKKGKTLRVPITIHANQYDLNDIYVIICPPLNLDSPDLRPHLLKLIAYFPIIYSKDFIPKSNGMLWRVTLREATPVHEDLILGFAFVVKWDARRVRDQLLAWEILVDILAQRHHIDLLAESFHVDAPLRILSSGKQQTRDISTAYIPKFVITYEGQNPTDLASQLRVIGLLHHTTVRIAASADSRCPDGIDFRITCPLLDPNEDSRPSWTEPVIAELIAKADAAAKIDTDVIIKQHLARIAPSCGLTKEALFEIVSRNSASVKVDAFSSVLANMLADNVIVINHSCPGLLKLNPARAPTKEIRLIFPNSYIMRAKERDVSIWIDTTFGAPADHSVIKYACWYLTAALSHSAFSKDPQDKISPYDLWRYAQAQAARIDKVLSDLTQTKHQKLWIDFDSSQPKSAEGDNIADEEPNPAFFAEPALLGEILESAERDSSVSLLAAPFLFPPQLKRHNWLYIMASRRENDSVHLQNIFLFKSRNSSAITISTLCVGDAHGRHYTQINLQMQQVTEVIERLGKRNGSMMLYSTLNSKFKHWKYIQHIFEELSIQEFLKGKRWKMQPIPFPDSEPAPHAPAPPAKVDDDADVSEDEEQDSEFFDTLSDFRARIIRLAESADEYSLYPHRQDLNGTLKKQAQTRLNSIASEMESISKEAIAGLKSTSSEKTRSQADTVHNLAATQVPIIRKMIAAIGFVARRGKLPVQPSNPPVSISHFMLKIKSYFRADSAITHLKSSEDLKSWTLLDSFQIGFMPYSQNSLHLSISMAAQHARSRYMPAPSSRDEKCERKGQENSEDLALPQLSPYLPPSRQTATLMQSDARNAYSKFAHLPVAPGKLSYRDYLTHKGANPEAYSEIPSDHVLCETSLIARCFQLNVAIIWHVNDRWRIFLLPLGPQSNITLVLLYTKMGVEQVPSKGGKSVHLQPCEAPCNRFFPLYPHNEEWIRNSAFKQAIPQSQDQSKSASIIAKIGDFNARVNKESIFAAIVEVEGSQDSPDTPSEATVDATYSQWMAEGFIDDDPIEQTPPSIFAMEEDRSLAISATNQLHAECIALIHQRKTHPRVDDSDLDSLLGPTSENRAQGAGNGQ